MPSTSDIRTCGTCLAPIVWTLTDAGKKMPVDAEEDPAGNQAVYKDDTGTIRSRALNGAASIELRPHEWRARPHFASCAAPPLRAPRAAPQPVRRPAPWRPR